MPFLNSESKLISSSSSSRSRREEVIQQKDHEVDANVLRAFNKHARECSRCAKPLEAARRGEMLCDQGHQMAYNVAKVLYNIAGEKAEEYRTSSGWHGILMDLTEFSGPVVDLVRAMDYGLRERKPSTVQPAVFSASIRPRPVNRPSTFSKHREGGSSPPSSRHHQHRHSYYYDSPTILASPYEDRAVVHHRRSESERSPRASGSLTVHVPLAQLGDIESGGEVPYYQEAYYPNGSKIITKTPQPLRLQRSKSIEAKVKTVSTAKSGSRVRFNDEVKYYT